MRRAVVLVVLALGAGVLPVRADATYYKEYDTTVGMSDGVRLDVSLYIPTGADHPLPLIVRQHGGGANKDSPYDVANGLKAVATGNFALLMYSARGHGNSEGMFDFFGPRTTKDFSEMLDWVHAKFDLVDTENVGVSGYSQGGGESLLPAEQDARVKAVAVGNTFDDLNHALDPNDCFKASFATGIFAAAYTASATKVDETLPVRWGASLFTDTEDETGTTKELHDRSPLTYVQSLVDRRVPVFWSNGWEDQLFPADHPERILQQLDAAGVPVHYWFNSGGHGATDFVPEQQAREAAMLDWFDQFLRGVDHGFTTGPKVDYWERTSGEPRAPGEWDHHAAPSWPIPDAHVRYLYADPGASDSLSAEPHDGDLSRTMVSPDTSVDLGNDAVVGIAASQVPVDVSGNVRALPRTGGAGSVAFDSLEVPWNVVGSPHVEVAFDTTMPLTQIDAKVFDVGGSGEQLAWRACATTPSGGALTIPLWPNAHAIAPGHRLRLELSLSDAPTFEPIATPGVVTLHSARLGLPVLS